MDFHIINVLRRQIGAYLFKQKADGCNSSHLEDVSIVKQGPRKFSSEQCNDQVLITPVDEAKRFMKECIVAAGASAKNAEIVAVNLITADHRGYYSHGMNRLEMYVKELQVCLTDGEAQPEVIKETQAIALVDGKNALGAVIGTMCMDVAIAKAKNCGIGFVTAKCCNHYGLASIYPLKAVDQGLIGFSVSNTSPLMCPIRAKQAALGTNPLSLAAPAQDGDSFVLDMATTAVALGKIEFYRRKGEKIPVGWALNDEGKPETDPTVAFKAAKLMPLGGTEENSGYKGYGLALMVEILSGVLAGSAYGPRIKKWGSTDPDKIANLGTSYMAINPKAFETGFESRLQDLICYIRNMEPVDPKKPVMVHGDSERIHMDKVRQDGGLRYVENQHKTIEKLSKELCVKPPSSKPLKKSK